MPTAPTNLIATTNQLSASLSWAAAGNSPTQYFVQVGFVPGQTAVEFAAGNTTTFGGSGAAGTHYVRVVAANAEGRGAPSNEVVVVLTGGGGGGCLPPSAPLNLRAIIRGGEAFIFWRQPAVGPVSGYTLQAGLGSGQTFAQFPANPALNTVQSSSSSLRVIASSACGNPASNEIQVSFPSNTVRVADPAPGTSLGMPDVSALVARIHAENPSLVNQSCPNGRVVATPGRIASSIGCGSKHALRLQRKADSRAGGQQRLPGHRRKRRGSPSLPEAVMESSPGVYTFDILSDHCGNPQQDVFRNIAPEPSIWTSARRFPDSKFKLVKLASSKPEGAHSGL